MADVQNLYSADSKKKNSEHIRSLKFAARVCLAVDTINPISSVTSHSLEIKELDHEDQITKIEESDEENSSSPVLGSRSKNNVRGASNRFRHLKHSTALIAPAASVINQALEISQNVAKVLQTSPILRSDRISRFSKSVTLTSPPWKKLQVDKSRVSKHTVSSCSNRADSPTLFINQDDSFLDNIDFDKIDTICSVESTPKRKVATLGTKRPLILNLTNSSRDYNLRKTPQRNALLKTLTVTERKENERIYKNRQVSTVECNSVMHYNNFYPSKHTYVNSCKRLYETQSSKGSVMPESSFSSNGVGQNARVSSSSLLNSSGEKSLCMSPQHPGRSSPDIFDDDAFDLSNGRLSESFDAELCQIEDGFFKKCSNTFSKNENSFIIEHIRGPPHTTHHEVESKSQDSELSFSSTLESQPLIGRFQSRLKASTSSHPSAPLKSDCERRAEAVATALEDAARIDKLGEDFQLGPFFGLPSKVAEVLKLHHGISELYEWQEECIKEGYGSRNLLVSLPTSGGKTLVAEILMLRQLLLKQCDAIFILPYVSLVQEKVRDLSPFGVELGFLVEEYAGSRGTFPPKPRRKKRVIYVATIEKASGLVNALLETGRIEELGIVVVDEVHMLGDTGGRGATLEGTLTKMRYAAPKVQLVAMSATVGNLQELAQYLDAKLYTKNFRPVELTEYIKIGQEIWEVNIASKADEDLLRNQRLCSFPYSNEQKRIDADMIAGLVGEVIPDYSCLVFCPTRRNCETLAELLCKVKFKRKVSLYQALLEEGGGSVCSVLRKTLPYGIAYHHSGLTEGERRLLEEGYLTGTLCCLCCTSTLAAGVNLPARRVIIRSPYTGREFLTRAKYKQMVGRAGRAGLDTSGESFLVLQPQDLIKAKSLFLTSVEVCCSTLTDNEDKGLTSLLFSSMGLGVAVSISELKRLTSFSLLALQKPTNKIDLDTKILEIVECLRKKGLVCIKREGDSQHSTPSSASTNESAGCHQPCEEFSKRISITPASKSMDNTPELSSPFTDDDIFVVSRFGRAAIKGSIDLSLASHLYKDLCLARENLAVNSHLHLLYLVISYDIVNSVSIIPDVYYKAYMALGEEELKVAKLLGITEGVIVKLSTGQKSKKVDQHVLHRFYVALLLHLIWSGMGIWQASDRFRVHRGFTQTALTSSAAFASCVYHFCQELEELWAFRDLLGNFARQISGCCSAELLPLMDLPAVKKGRARMLYNAGFHTLKDIANSEPSNLVEIVKHLPYRAALQIINSAKMLLIERADTLQGEAEEVLLGLRQNNQHSLSDPKHTLVPLSKANLISKPSQSTSPNILEASNLPVTGSVPVISQHNKI
ncbi:hypothetical protein OTU49_007645 [Cherax quadricarinatus]|uniref:Helicase POLQ-like n=1 Tax=Cherax quadricarinatus TaxID=27406 RepID=A0AAW0X0G2_CHEQU